MLHKLESRCQGTPCPLFLVAETTGAIVSIIIRRIALTKPGTCEWAGVYYRMQTARDLRRTPWRKEIVLSQMRGASVAVLAVKRLMD